MQKITSKTGFGYISDSDGNIITKCKFPPGKHSLKDNYTYTEVNSQIKLDAIKVYVQPESVEKARERKIQEELYLMAEERLKEKGEWED